MNSNAFQILSALLIIFGEFLAITAEIFAAQRIGQGQPMGQTFWSLSIPMLIGSLSILGGYVLGYYSFKSIWIVTVLSVGSIAVIEPILIYTFFREIPEKGALVGIILAFAAIGIAMVWK